MSSYFVQQNGVDIQWLQRSVSFSNAYNTDNQQTFGYGDSVCNYITGGAKAVIRHVSAKDIILESGFWIDDYEDVYIDPSSNIAEWDMLIIPSGSNEKYLVLSRHIWRMDGNIIIAKHIMCRRLLPRSGSSY